MNNPFVKWKIVIKHSDNSRAKLEVKTWGLLVTLPKELNEEEVYSLLEKHKGWIEKRYSELREALNISKNIKIVERSIGELRELAQKILEEATHTILGINPCKLVIRRMKTRWASCSSKGILTLNNAAKYLPDDIIAYIIYHEVCHILEPRHNSKFWECISTKYPNFREIERILMAYEIKLALRDI